MPIHCISNIKQRNSLIKFAGITTALCLAMISCENQSPTEEAIEDTGDAIEDVTDGPDSKLENVGEDLKDAAEEATE